MTHDFERTHLWKSSLAKRAEADEHEIARDRLRGAYLKFRDRASHLVSTIKSELPGLTVHDITHLDALWRVASEIAGPTYELTPAEAFVLGGAILLHDSAHAIAAFPGGKTEIKQTQHWRDLIAQRYNRQEPAGGSDDERAALFQVLRHLHATQAAKLPFVKWTVPGDNTPNFLIEDAELRNYYGELIGKIAESHHWPAHRVATEFSHQNHTPPSYLPTEWTVDAMKIAFLLRTADAAHIDDGRAPWFLFALQKPQGISEQHWRFQSKLGQAKCNKHGELQISSGPSFNMDEREAWWLAYDTVQMIDRELRDAHGLMRDHARGVFQAVSVLGAGSPDSFARYVKPKDWEPIDVAPKIGNANKIIEMLGGTKLYGNRPDLAIRELLQNAIDAIHAKRALGGLGNQEGEIIVGLDRFDSENFVLRVSDNGVGMSRHVLTHVLLDFGNSLWKSDALREHVPGLASTRFQSSGQFGIGFFATFMLGEVIEVKSQPYARLTVSEGPTDSILRFGAGLKSRPCIAAGGTSRGEASGTTITVVMSIDKANSLIHYFGGEGLANDVNYVMGPVDRLLFYLQAGIAYLVPASDVSIIASVGDARICAVQSNDWMSLTETDLVERITRARRLPKRRLYPVHDQNGDCVGRVGFGAPHLKDLALTQNGIVLERQVDLTGILKAEQPETAIRTTAKLLPLDKRSWTQWAVEAKNSVVHEAAHPRNLILLSHLVDDDFAVYEFRGTLKSLAEVITELASQTDVVVHVGDVEHNDDWDEISGSNFRRDFRLLDDILVVPETPRLPTVWSSVGLAKIDFEDRLRQALAKIWPNLFEGNSPDQQVGTANGIPIFREVTVFSRD